MRAQAKQALPVPASLILTRQAPSQTPLAQPRKAQPPQAPAQQQPEQNQQTHWIVPAPKRRKPPHNTPATS